LLRRGKRSISIRHRRKNSRERIVQFREANGPFAAPEDIMKVPGIAVKIFEANKNIIAVE
jgi:competence ComEA-like helix-hairpin-helix protein